MNGTTFEVPGLIVATITLSVSTILAMAMLRWLRPAEFGTHRWIWLLVLLNGVVLTGYSLELPVLSPPQTIPTSDAMAIADTDGGVPQNASSPVEDNRHYDASESSSGSPTTTSATVATDETTANSALLLTSEFQPSFAPLRAPFTITQILGWIWFAGFSATLFLLGFRYWRFWRAMQTSTVAPHSWQRQCDQLARKLGVQRSIPLVTHCYLGPALAATPHGTKIVVPNSLWQRLSHGQRAAVLKHELAHFIRRDLITSQLSLLVAAIHWFNPFAWLAVRYFHQSAEWACDRHAIAGQAEGAAFARALLSLSTSDANHLVGANGIGTSDLRQRVQRLLAPPKRTTVWARMTLVLLMLTILALAWLDIRLISVASAGGNSPPAQQDEVQLEQNIDAFSKRLADSGELHAALKKIASSREGIISISSQIAQVQQEMQREASRTAIVDFLETQADQSYYQQLRKSADEAKKDIESVATALQDIRTQLRDDSETAKLLMRFIDSDHAPLVLYFGELRRSIRPDHQLLMRRLGQFLALNEAGNYLVRESAKIPLRERLEHWNNMERHLEFLRSESKRWSNEIHEKDDLHRKVKERMASGRGSVFVLASIMSDTSLAMHEKIDRYFNSLEAFFSDTADGLVVNEDRIEQLETAMDNVGQMIVNADRIRPAVAAIAHRIDTSSGELEQQIQQFLVSDIGVAFIAKDMNLQAADSNSIANRVVTALLTDNGEDGYQIREDRVAAVEDFARRLLRAGRRLRRQLHTVEQLTQHVKNPTHQQLLERTEARIIMIEKVTQYLQNQQFDAWPTWLEKHFEEREGKYWIRDDAKDSIKELIDQALELKRQLQNDDF